MINYEGLYSILDKSSERTRSVIYIMLVASVLIFIPYWNVGSGNWLSTRIGLRQNIIKWYGWRISDSLKLSSEQDRVDFHNSRAAGQLLGINNQNNKDSILTVSRLENEIIELKKINITRSFISIPFFNVSVDINDLGLFGGFSFIVILLILRACLVRELSNIRYVFHEAEKSGELALAYEYLSLSQVLTKPPLATDVKRSRWSSLSLSYLLLPLAVEVYSIFFDLDEIQFALVQNHQATLHHIILNFLSLIIVLFLTFRCIQISIAYNQEWKGAAAKVYPSRDQKRGKHFQRK